MNRFMPPGTAAETSASLRMRSLSKSSGIARQAVIHRGDHELDLCVFQRRMKRKADDRASELVAHLKISPACEPIPGGMTMDRHRVVDLRANAAIGESPGQPVAIV